MTIDIYPVGWLAALLRLRRAYAADFPAEHRAEARAHTRGAVRYQLRCNVEQIRARKWRELKNTFNGYLAEPTPFPAGVRRCGSGWTKRRAGRSLHRQLAAAASSATCPCPAPAPSYFCPTSGEAESPCHGGFDVCCGRPDLHVMGSIPKDIANETPDRWVERVAPYWLPCCEHHLNRPNGLPCDGACCDNCPATGGSS